MCLNVEKRSRTWIAEWDEDVNGRFVLCSHLDVDDGGCDGLHHGDVVAHAL